MKKVFTMMVVLFAVVAFACVSFAAPEGKIRTQTPPASINKVKPVIQPKAKVDKTKTDDVAAKEEEAKKNKDQYKGRKKESKPEETKKK